MEKKYFNVNKKNTVKNSAITGRMLRKREDMGLSLDLNLNVDPIHIKKEEVSAQMEDCAIDVYGPTLEVEGQDVVIPAGKDQSIKAGKIKIKFDLGGGRMNQTASKSAYEMMGGLLNMISDMWDQKVKEDNDKPEDGFDPVEE